MVQYGKKLLKIFTTLLMVIMVITIKVRKGTNKQHTEISNNKTNVIRVGFDPITLVK